MHAFAALLERIVLTPSRNRKIELMVHYFRDTPDPDRGIGLAAITGTLDLPAVKPALIRQLAEEVHRPGAVPHVLRLCRRPCRDGGADLAGRHARARGGPAAVASRA